MWISLFSFRVVVFHHITSFFFFPFPSRRNIAVAVHSSLLPSLLLTLSLPLLSLFCLQDCGGRGQEADRRPVWRLSAALQKPQCWHNHEQHGENSLRAFFTFGLCVSVVRDFIVSGPLWNSLFALAVKYTCPATELNCLLDWMPLSYSMCL